MDDWDRGQWFVRNANNLRTPRIFGDRFRKSRQIYWGDVFIRAGVILVCLGAVILVCYNLTL